MSKSAICLLVSKRCTIWDSSKRQRPTIHAGYSPWRHSRMCHVDDDAQLHQPCLLLKGGLLRNVYRYLGIKKMLLVSLVSLFIEAPVLGVWREIGLLVKSRGTFVDNCLQGQCKKALNLRLSSASQFSTLMFHMA